MTESASFADYIERMAEIRTLSSPELLDFDSAEDYTERLRENFSTIGRLAGVNRMMLDNDLLPLLDSDEPLSEEQIANLSALGDKLLNVGGIEEYESLDLPMMSLISGRLTRDAHMRADIPELIVKLDTEIMSCYSLVSMTSRITTRPEICEEYRMRGLIVGEFFLSLLDKERFLEIEEVELRGLVLTNCRFSVAFYEHALDQREANARYLEVLDRMWEIAHDPFYIEAVPGFDWKYFKFRTLEYYIQSTEFCNARGLTDAQLAQAADKTDKMEELCASDPAFFGDLIGALSVPFDCARARYLVGQIDREAYLKSLVDAYEQRDVNDFGSNGLDANIAIPLEIVSLVGRGRRSAEENMLLKRLYRNLASYLFHTPGASAISFSLEYVAAMVESFVDVSSGMSFEEFALQIIGAVHPPTYVHSCMVAQLTECVCAHLCDLRPDLLVGLFGCSSEEAVRRERGRIVSFAYHAALCHDVGKLPEIDTIFMYGRKLLDLEFEVIKEHPNLGAHLLRKHLDTREYADIARGHHRWYDNSRGYPEDFDTRTSDYKPLIDLIACMDCMDAATDSVGRSYKQGKSLDDFLEELRDGEGTRYAPWLFEVMSHPKVHRDLEFLLDKGRMQVYRDTYLLLRSVNEQGKLVAGA